MASGAHAKTAAEFGPARIIEVDAGTCCAGAWANMTITRWVGRGTASSVECVMRVGDQIRAQYPMGISSVHLIAEGAGLPAADAREGLVKLMNRHTDRLACVGIVVGGTGFWASAIRSFITGMRAVSSRAYELKLVGSIEELVVWLPTQHFKRSGIALDSGELTRALQTASEWRADAP